MTSTPENCGCESPHTGWLKLIDRSACTHAKLRIDLKMSEDKFAELMVKYGDCLSSYKREFAEKTQRKAEVEALSGEIENLKSRIEAQRSSFNRDLRGADSGAHEQRAIIRGLKAENAKLVAEVETYEGSSYPEMTRALRTANDEIADLARQLLEAKEEVGRLRRDAVCRARKPCASNREGVPCTSEVFYLCYHCEYWYCNAHGAEHFGPHPDDIKLRRPTTCLLEQNAALVKALETCRDEAKYQLISSGNPDCGVRLHQGAYLPGSHADTIRHTAEDALAAARKGEQ